MGKNKSIGATSTTLMIVVGLFIMAIPLGFALGEGISKSVFDFDNTKKVIDNGGKYPELRIENTFGFGKDIWTGTLTKNTDTCGVSCSAEKTITITEPTELISNVRFKTLQEDGSWVNQPIRNYNFFIKTDESQYSVDDFEYQCVVVGFDAKNNSDITECNNVKVGSHLETTPLWEEYDIGEVLTPGTYEIKLEGQKKPSRTVDWQIKTNGEWLDEWANWTSSTLLDGGLFYYAMEDTLNNSIITNSITANQDGINLTSITKGVTGKINLGFNLSEDPPSGGGINTTYKTPVGLPNDFTIAGWMNATSTGQFQTLMGDGSSALVGGFYLGVRGGSHTELELYVRNNSVAVINAATQSGSPNVIDGNWHHVALTYDRSLFNWSVYIDGVFYAFDDSIGELGNSTQELKIGGAASNNAWFGELDEWGSWTRILTVSEVLDLNNSGLSYPFQTNYTTLNSPTDNFISSTAAITFNGTSIVTGGVALVNMSLWHNGTGTWALNQTETYILPATFSHGFADDDTSGARTTKYGFKLLTKSNFDVNVITKYATDVSTDCFVLDSSEVVLASGTFTGVNCSISYTLANNTVYYFAADGAGASIVHRRVNPGSVDPQDLTIFNITTGFDNGIDSANQRGTIQSITTGGVTSQEQIFTSTISAPTLWNLQACDTDGDCGFAPSNFTVLLDNTNPVLDLTNPTGLKNYSRAGATEVMNWTVSDTGLDSCWYDYNTTNTTVTCSNNGTLLTIEEGNYNVTFYANDTAGNEVSNFTSWSYKVFENSRTFNGSSVETAAESFILNVSANTSLTAVGLVYNNTVHTTTLASNISTVTFDIPIGVYNNTFNWTFTYGSETFSSDSSGQNISLLNLSLGGVTPYVNFTFADENNLTALSGIIPTSNFTYYLGSGTVSKELIYTNTSGYPSYAFTPTPVDRLLNINSRIQYEATGYQQRVFDPVAIGYTNTTTNTTLYLLSTADGIFVTFQVINSAEQIIEGVFINATRLIGASQELVGEGFTDSSGALTMWLDPDFVHSFSFSKATYTTLLSTFAPTQTSYTVTLGSGSTSSNVTDVSQGITYTITPQSQTLYNDTSYDFEFNLTSTYWDVDSWGFYLYNGSATTDTLLASQTSTANGGTLTQSLNVGSNDTIIMDYFWIVNSTTANGTKTFFVLSSAGTDWSINNTLTDFRTYFDTGMFGLDDFGIQIIAFLIIFLFAGVMSFKYGITSPGAVSMLVFAIVFFLDVGLGILPNPVNAMPHFITVFMAIVSLGLFFREGLR